MLFGRKRDIREERFQAEGGLYWIRVRDDGFGVQAEDLFTANGEDKKPMTFPSWEAAVDYAGGKLEKYRGQVEELLPAMEIKETSLCGGEIALAVLSQMYPAASRVLKELLASRQDFDTGWAGARRGTDQVRIIAVDRFIIIKFKKDGKSTTPSTITERDTPYSDIVQIIKTMEGR